MEEQTPQEAAATTIAAHLKTTLQEKKATDSTKKIGHRTTTITKAITYRLDEHGKKIAKETHGTLSPTLIEKETPSQEEAPKILQEALPLALQNLRQEIQANLKLMKAQLATKYEVELADSGTTKRKIGAKDFRAEITKRFHDDLQVQEAHLDRRLLASIAQRARLEQAKKSLKADDIARIRQELAALGKSVPNEEFLKNIAASRLQKEMQATTPQPSEEPAFTTSAEPQLISEAATLPTPTELPEPRSLSEQHTERASTLSHRIQQRVATKLREIQWQGKGIIGGIETVVKNGVRRPAVVAFSTVALAGAVGTPLAREVLTPHVAAAKSHPVPITQELQPSPPPNQATFTRENQHQETPPSPLTAVKPNDEGSAPPPIVAPSAIENPVSELPTHESPAPLTTGKDPGEVLPSIEAEQPKITRERVFQFEDLTYEEAKKWLKEIRNHSDQVITESLFTNELARMPKEQRIRALDVIAEAHADALIAHYGDKKMLVGLDPGHGGADAGSAAKTAEGTMLKEPAVNYALVINIAKILEQKTQNMWVVILRTDTPLNETTDAPSEGQQKRAALLRKLAKQLAKDGVIEDEEATLQLSVHFNGAANQSSLQSGIEAYWPNETGMPDAKHRKSSQQLAQTFQEITLRYLKEKANYNAIDRGAKVDYDLAFPYLMLGGPRQEHPLPYLPGHQPLIAEQPIPENKWVQQETENSRPLKLIFAHGMSGKGYDPSQPNGSYYDVIAAKAESLQIDASFPQLPESDNPQAEAWVATLRAELEKADQQGQKSILMGHSLGTRGILLLLNSLLDPDKPTFNQNLAYSIQEIVLYAPLDNKPANATRHPDASHYASFFSGGTGSIKPEIMQEIQRRWAKRITVIHGQQDSVVPFDQGKKLSEKLGAKFIPLPGNTHSDDPELGIAPANALTQIANAYLPVRN